MTEIDINVCVCFFFILSFLFYFNKYLITRFFSFRARYTKVWESNVRSSCAIMGGVRRKKHPRQRFRSFGPTWNRYSHKVTLKTNKQTNNDIGTLNSTGCQSPMRAAAFERNMTPCCVWTGRSSAAFRGPLPSPCTEHFNFVNVRLDIYQRMETGSCVRADIRISQLTTNVIS